MNLTQSRNAKYYIFTRGSGGEEEGGDETLGAAGGIMSACLDVSNASRPQATEKCFNKEKKLQ